MKTCPSCGSDDLKRGEGNLWCNNCGFFPIPFDDLPNKLKEGLADEFDIPVLDFSKIENPQFDKIPWGNNPHDWRAYIPDICIKLWDELSDETKMALYAIAQYRAHNEEWD